MNLPAHSSVSCPRNLLNFITIFDGSGYNDAIVDCMHNAAPTKYAKDKLVKTACPLRKEPFVLPKEPYTPSR